MSEAETWFLALCINCTPLLPQPFSQEGERNTWVTLHKAATGHKVLLLTEPPAIPAP